VPGAVAGLDTEAFDGVEDDEAGDEGGELRVAGVAEFVGVGVEQEAGDVAFGHLRGLIDEFPALVVGPRSAHARPL
jgi:hypothetical protein